MRHRHTAIFFDAVKHLLLCTLEELPPKLDTASGLFLLRPSAPVPSHSTLDSRSLVKLPFACEEGATRSSWRSSIRPLASRSYAVPDGW